MAATNGLAVRLDEKGRITLPKKIRESLDVSAGDLLFFKYEAKTGQARLARAVNPFENLAETAVKEYRKGGTRRVREFARKNRIRL